MRMYPSPKHWPSLCSEAHIQSKASILWSSPTHSVNRAVMRNTGTCQEAPCREGAREATMLLAKIVNCRLPEYVLLGSPKAAVPGLGSQACPVLLTSGWLEAGTQKFCTDEHAL